MATNAAVLDEMAKPPPPYSGPTQSNPAMPSAQPRPAQANLVTPLTQLRDTPQNIDCPFCQRQTQTRVTLSNSSSTTYVTQPMHLLQMGGRNEQVGCLAQSC